jgi:hypothetical protein
LKPYKIALLDMGGTDPLFPNTAMVHHLLPTFRTAIYLAYTSDVSLFFEVNFVTFDNEQFARQTKSERGGGFLVSVVVGVLYELKNEMRAVGVRFRRQAEELEAKAGRIHFQGTFPAISSSADVWSRCF